MQARKKFEADRKAEEEHRKATLGSWEWNEAAGVGRQGGRIDDSGAWCHECGAAGFRRWPLAVRCAAYACRPAHACCLPTWCAPLARSPCRILLQLAAALVL